MNKIKILGNKYCSKTNIIYESKMLRKLNMCKYNKICNANINHIKLKTSYMNVIKIIKIMANFEL